VPLTRPAGYFVLSRFGVLFAALVSKWIYPNLSIPFALGDGWDGGWFLRVAQHGYPSTLANEYGGGNRWSFFPAFPTAVRFVVITTGLTYDHAAILASFLCGLASAVAVWLMVREVFGPKVADRTVLFYVFFPSAYVLSMAYSEGILVAAACFCVYALSRRWWVAAGILASVASLSRNVGVVLVLCVVVATVPEIVRGKERLHAVAGLLLAPVGFVSWLVYAWRRTGTPIAFVKVQRDWSQAHFTWFKEPFVSVSHLFGGYASFKAAADVLATAAVVFIVSGLGMLLWAQLKKVPIPLFWWAFAVGGVLVAFSGYWQSATLRLALVLIPLMAAFAWRIRPSWTGAVVGSMAMAQGCLAVIIFVGLAHPQATLLSP
jgi:4-amino-4-deoxy-L-arabinose transferase-like glycosyltransferase